MGNGNTNHRPISFYHYTLLCIASYPQFFYFVIHRSQGEFLSCGEVKNTRWNLEESIPKVPPRIFCFCLRESARFLASVFDTSHLADDGHFDLAWVFHFLLDLNGYVAGERMRFEVANLLRGDKDAHFAAGGKRIGFLDAGS